jgi:WD40 repeat protein
MVWNAGTGELRERLSLGETNLRGLAFSSDDPTLYTAGHDRGIRRWDLRGRSLCVAQLVEPREFGFGWASQAPGGAAMVHAVADRRTKFLDTSTGELSRVGPQGGFYTGAWNTRGDEFAAATGGLVQIWSPKGELLRDNHGEELTPSTTSDTAATEPASW